MDTIVNGISILQTWFLFKKRSVAAVNEHENSAVHLKEARDYLEIKLRLQFSLGLINVYFVIKNL